MTSFAPKLLAWFDVAGRKDLPWQTTPPNIYSVWVSEVMLQQTTVATVIPYFDRFITRFPTLKSLAKADLDDVLLLWSGLGYYARARNLHRCAQVIVEDFGGHFPKELAQVMGLPGIGESTAAAILSTVYDQPHAILDGNVKRVLSRYHCLEGHSGQSAYRKKLWEWARFHTPSQRNADYTQAIMDLGAMVCRRRQPLCDECPIESSCQAAQTEATDRYPQSRPKTKKPTRSVTMLVIVGPEGGVYLEKRPPTGIWGGLWSFPECEGTEESILATLSDLGVTATCTTPLKSFKHTFTHYHLNIRPIAFEVGTTPIVFHSRALDNLGVPTPIRRILKSLDPHTAPGVDDADYNS